MFIHSAPGHELCLVPGLDPGQIDMADIVLPTGAPRLERAG